MSNRKMIRAFAESKGHKVKGFLYLLPRSSDMRNGKWMWYKDLAGTKYLILPKYNRVCQMYNIRTGTNIENKELYKGGTHNEYERTTEEG